MADPLYELLAPYFDQPDSPSSRLPPPNPHELQTHNYLARLGSLSVAELTSNEPASLQQLAQSQLRNLQALSKRSHRAIISSSSHLSSLGETLPSLNAQRKQLQDLAPDLENTATKFAQKYDRNAENAVLDRRKEAMLLSRNIDRVSDILELPTLLASTVNTAQAAITFSNASATTSYSSALELQGHVKRLSTLYSQSELIRGISNLADGEMKNMATMLIFTLQSPQLKLASAMRTVGWLRRVAPDLGGNERMPLRSSTSATFGSSDFSTISADDDGGLEVLFLVCRLHMLYKTLDALDPLRELADQESVKRKKGMTEKSVKQQQQDHTAIFGTQTERFLKRYIEIFREQSFSIISMYKSVFPSGLPSPAELADSPDLGASEMSLLPQPSALGSFALHIEGMLTSTLHNYIPNVADRSARESLLTQVLYCAGSLGRLGADFGMSIALLYEDVDRIDGAATAGNVALGDEPPEWVNVMKKHRVQASRLEVLARGVGTGRKASAEIAEPTSTLSAT